MDVFDHNDQAYLEWLHQHPDGYVVNRRRGRSESYLVLHRASCRTVRTYTQMARPGGFTERDYIKVCAPDIGSLEAYVHTTGAAWFSTRCTACAP